MSLIKKILVTLPFVIFYYVAVPITLTIVERKLKIPDFFPKGSNVLGIILLAAGGGLALWCTIFFYTEGEGTPNLRHPPNNLVIRGPYKVVRNPMMIGNIVAIIGLSFILNSVFLFLFVLLMLPVVVLQTRSEENELVKKFGQNFLDYQKNTGAWLPKVR